MELGYLVSVNMKGLGGRLSGVGGGRGTKNKEESNRGWIPRVQYSKGRAASIIVYIFFVYIPN